MPGTVKDWTEAALGARLPVHMATSRHLSAVHPFFTESGLIHPLTGEKIPGLPYGRCGRDGSGGIHTFDEYMLYQAKLLNNANVKVLGDINYRKSMTVKFMIYCGVIVGFNHLVIDPKGEYTALVDQINEEAPGYARIVRVGKEAQTFINPLDEAVMDLGVQRDLVASLACTAINDDTVQLGIVERELLWTAITDAHNHYGVGTRRMPTLPAVVEKLFNPSESMAIDMRKSKDELVTIGYKMALGLQRLTRGDLVGMYHQETSPGLFDETPLLVMNVAGLQGEAALMMIILINMFSQSLWARRNPMKRFHKVINDEAWDLAAYPEFVLSLQRAFKLGGTWGVSNWIVTHRLTDLDRSGSIEAIKGLKEDSEVTICFRQPEGEMKVSAEALNFTEAEAERVTQLPPGWALHKVGNQPAIEVEHVIPRRLRPVMETRHLMHGQTDLPRAA